MKYKAKKKGKRDEKQRFKCIGCDKWFVENLKKEEKNDKSFSIQNLVFDHLYGISYRKLNEKYGMNRTTICEIVNKFVSTLKSNIEITKLFFDQTNYSGNHVIDGKYIPVKEEIIEDENVIGKIPKSKKRRKVLRGIVLVWGADYETHDIPVHVFGRSEDRYTFEKYFGHLKKIGYEMKSCTIDDKKEMIYGIYRHYPDCIIQQCIKHYLTKVSGKFAIQSIKIKITAREKQIDKLFVDSNNDYVPISRFNSLKRIAKLNNEIADFEFKYELLMDFQNILTSILHAKNHKKALRKIKSLNKYFLPRMRQMNYPKEQIKKVEKIYKDFQLNKEYLLNYLKYPHLNIPATTNLIEGYNSHLELRLASIRGFESILTAKNYINALILKKRFTKFSCCRKSFKHLNGKTPLECAGVDSSTIQSWVDVCRN